LRITVDLSGNGSDIVGYRANKVSPPIDLSKISHYDTADFWDPIYKNDKLQYVLEPSEFYILASKQRVRVPPDFAAEMLPYDLATQEFRVHYAGFFDPGFGYGTHGEIPGTRAVLEVRATQMPILLEHDQFVGRLNYYKMSRTPERVYGGSIGSSYQQQGLALSKQFKRGEQYTSSSGSKVAIAAKGDPEPAPSQIAPRSEMTEDDDDYASVLSLAFPETSASHLLNAKNH
jgi:dCTP deaminase